MGVAGVVDKVGGDEPISPWMERRWKKSWRLSNVSNNSLGFVGVGGAGVVDASGSVVGEVGVYGCVGVTGCVGVVGAGGFAGVGSASVVGIVVVGGTCAMPV